MSRAEDDARRAGAGSSEIDSLVRAVAQVSEAEPPRRDQDMIGRRIGRFEILARLGAGGMGVVYTAEDPTLRRRIALKVLPAARVGDPQRARRFAAEAAALASLDHPAIVRYVAHGTTPDGEPFLAMEWLEGEDLAQRLRRGSLGVRESKALGLRVAEALVAAHARGIIHRDIKPSNLFLRGGDPEQVTLLDFGIARLDEASLTLTATGAVIGTPGYMAPEQARGGEIDARADIFALGCVLYECLAGQAPFAAEHLAAVLVRILFEDPPPLDVRRPGLPRPLIALLARMLAKDPAHRPGDAQEVAAALLALHAASGDDITLTDSPAQDASAQEQSLVCVVLATPRPGSPESPAPLAGTVAGGELRRQLGSALASLGAVAEWLLEGSLIVPLRSRGSAVDQAVLAARAALVVQDRWPDALIAVATGRGSFRNLVLIGEAFDRAAELVRGRSSDAGEPRPDGIWIDTLTAKLLDRSFVITTHAGGALLTSQELSADESQPLMGRPTPCVGREQELTVLDAALAACVEESEPRVVRVTAPAGMGKSRLRHEFLRRLAHHDRDLTILSARGELMGAGAPYRVLGATLRRLSGVTGREPPAEQGALLGARIGRHVGSADRDRVVAFLGELSGLTAAVGSPALRAARHDPKLMEEQVRRAFVEWLRAECMAAPILFVLDDGQWADALTVSLLEHALEQLRDVPLLVIVLARPDALTHMDAWKRHAPLEIVLRPLSNKARQRLVEHVLGRGVSPGVLARIVDSSVGNALYLEELIRASAEHGDQGPPDTVLAMLQARIEALPSDVRRALRAASVFGQVFWESGVAALLGVPGERGEPARALSILVDAELLRIQDNPSAAGTREYAFRHTLMREAAYALVNDEERPALHRLAGIYLEKREPSDPRTIAEHWMCGRDEARAAIWLAVSAQQSLDGNDLTEAIAQAEWAVSAGAGSDALGGLRGIQATAAFWQSNYVDCQRYAEAALPLLPPGSAAWFRIAGHAIVSSFRLSDAAAADRLRETAERSPAAPEGAIERINCLARCGLQLLMHGRRPQVDALIERLSALTVGVEITDPRARAHYHHLLGMRAGVVGDYATYATCLEEVVAVFEQAGDLRNLAVERTTLAAIYGQLGRFEEAETLCRSNLEECRRLGVHQALSFAKATLALILTLGRTGYPEARQLLAEAEEEYRDTGHVRRLGQVYAYQAFLHHIEGDQAAACARADLAVRALEATPSFRAWALAVHAWATLRLGHAEEALLLAREAVEIADRLGGLPVGELHPRLCLGEVLMALGEIAEARRTLAAADERLQLRAGRIERPDWRERYLALPEHRDLLALAERLLRADER